MDGKRGDEAMIRPFLLFSCGSGRCSGSRGVSSGFDGFGFVISYRLVRERVMSYAGVDPLAPSRKPTSYCSAPARRETNRNVDIGLCIGGLAGTRKIRMEIVLDGVEQMKQRAEAMSSNGQALGSNGAPAGTSI